MIKQINNHKTIVDGFKLIKNVPLDKRLVIDSIATVNQEIFQNHRYQGLIFFAKEQQAFYTFDEGLVNPIQLFTIANLSNNYSINVPDYKNIGTELNKIAITGKVIFVTPLNVYFKYDGLKWEYLTGKYNIRTDLDLNNLANDFKQVLAPVNYKGDDRVFGKDFSIVEKYKKVDSSTNIDNYQIDNLPTIVNHSIFEYKENTLYKVGTKFIQLTNQNINVGLNELYRFKKSDSILTPPFTKVVVWINNYIDKTSNKQYTIPVELQSVYDSVNDEFVLYALSESSFNNVIIDINFL